MKMTFKIKGKHSCKNMSKHFTANTDTKVSNFGQISEAATTVDHPESESMFFGRSWCELPFERFISKRDPYFS